MARPVFQHQGPDRNCVIDSHAIGWLSCTAYAMAMLIDAATDGVRTPKGCQVRNKVKPQDVEGGLTLGQVSRVAREVYGVPIVRRTGLNAIKIENAARRIQDGQGFVLQGNNDGWEGRKFVQHAVYVDRVRGGTRGAPAEALVYDSQRRKRTDTRTGAVWMPWSKVMGFGKAMRVNSAGAKVPAGRIWAGFGPQRMARAAAGPHPLQVTLAFGAVKLAEPAGFRATPPPGRRINVRATPRSTAAEPTDLLEDGELFVAWQRVDDGARPSPGATQRWFGSRDGTDWVHASGLRRIPGPVPDGNLEGVDETGLANPAEPATDLAEPVTGPGPGEGPDDVPNGDLAEFQADPAAVDGASDASPDDVDADFEGDELSDAEIDALPVVAG